jgi:glutamate racemase
LAGSIRAVLPAHVTVVDSALTTAAAVLQRLRGGAAPPESDAAAGLGRGRGGVTWLATDGAVRFARVGSTFLGEPLSAGAVEIIDL